MSPSRQPGWLQRGIRRTIDRLARLAIRSSGPTRRIVFGLLRGLSPVLAAKLWFRQGNLTKALDALGESKSPYRAKIENMLDDLSSAQLSDAPRSFSGAFNGHVLHALHSSMPYDNNGYAIRSIQIIEALSAISIRSTVATRLGYPWDLTQHIGQPVLETSRWADVDVLHRYDPRRRIGGDERAYVRSYSQWLRDLAIRAPVDVLHAHSNYLNGLAAAVAGEYLGTPVVYEMRGLWHESRAVAEPGYRDTEHFRYCEQCEVRAALSADRVVVLSESLKGWLLDRGVGADKVDVIGNAAAPVDRIVRPERPPSERCRGRLGYIGSIVSYEGVDCLLRALFVLRSRGYPASLVVVGDGPGLSDAKRECHRLKLGSHVEFTGRLNPTLARARYAEIDIAVIPRLSNPVTELVPPLKPFEVMAYGVPLVASAVRPIAEVVDDGGNGLLFRPGDADHLAEIVARVLDSPELASELVEAGRTFALARSWEANARRYNAVYKRCFVEPSSTRA